MDRQKIENMAKEFFDSYEENRKQQFKKLLIFLGSSAAGIIIGWVLLEFLNAGIVIEYISYALLIAGIVLAVISKKTFNKIRKSKKDAEGALNTDVISQIVAGELGGKCEAEYFETKLSKSTAKLGDVQKSITKTFTGSYNGKNYSINQEYTELVTEIKEYRNNGKKYKQKIYVNPVYGDTVYGFDARHTVSGRIMLDSPSNKMKYASEVLGKNYVNSVYYVEMDNKEFPFTVKASDEVTAYKFLTPGMMSDLTGFSKQYGVKLITFEDDSAKAIFDKRIAEMDIPVSFFGSIGKIREKYSADYLYSLAEPSIKAIKALLSDSARISGNSIG